MMYLHTRYYIEDKVGYQNAPGFETWAFGETQPTTVRLDKKYLIELWNNHHPQTLSSNKNFYDCLDRMIEIWKDRFG